ncbi:MAG: tyrosine-type recombinase/integrase [Methanothrix sp.]
MNSSLRPLAPQERDRLLSALRSEGDKIMLRLLLETGRPIEDLLATRTSDLDRDRRTLRLRRGGVGGGGRVDGRRGDGGDEGEEIRLSPELSAAVEDYIEKNPGKVYLFEGRCGRPVGPKWVRCTLHPAAIRSGIDDPAAGKG